MLEFNCYSYYPRCFLTKLFGIGLFFNHVFFLITFLFFFYYLNFQIIRDDSQRIILDLFGLYLCFVFYVKNEPINEFLIYILHIPEKITLKKR